MGWEQNQLLYSCVAGQAPLFMYNNILRIDSSALFKLTLLYPSYTVHGVTGCF